MPFTWTPECTLEQAERRIIEECLKFTHGNKSAVARILGIAPRTLDYKLEKYTQDDDQTVKVTTDWEKKRLEEVNRLKGNWSVDPKTGAKVLMPDGWTPAEEGGSGSQPTTPLAPYVAPQAVATTPKVVKAETKKPFTKKKKSI